MNSLNHSYNLLAYAKKLRHAGFTEEQAEVQAGELASLVYEKLVTKQDLKVALESLKTTLRSDIKSDIKNVESKLLFKLLSAMVILNGGFFAGFATLVMKMVH
jgi:hypothetical protein